MPSMSACSSTKLFQTLQTPDLHSSRTLLSVSAGQGPGQQPLCLSCCCNTPSHNPHPTHHAPCSPYLRPHSHQTSTHTSTAPQLTFPLARSQQTVPADTPSSIRLCCIRSNSRSSSRNGNSSSDPVLADHPPKLLPQWAPWILLAP